MKTIQLHQDATKPSRKLAYEHVKALLEGSTADNDLHLHELLLFFAPVKAAKTKTVKNLFDNACRFTGDKDVREWVNYVLVNNDKVYATNGHVMIRTENDEKRENGYYCPKTKAKVPATDLRSNFSSSQFDSMLEGSTQHAIDINTDLSPCARLNNKAPMLHYKLPEILGGFGVQSQYVNLINNNEGGVVHFTTGGKGESLKASTPYGDFLVMPMHL